MEELQGWTAVLEGGKGHALKDKMVEECISFWSSHFRPPFYKQCELSPSWKKKTQTILIIHFRKSLWTLWAFRCCFHDVDKQLQWWFLRWCFRTKRGICCSGRGGFSESAAPSEISFSRGLVLKKECSYFPCAFSPLLLWYWRSRVFSRVSAC